MTNGIRLDMFLCIIFGILSAQVTFGRILTETKCDSESDCPEGHSCEEKICKKCLRCEILFRKGNSCVTDFNNCGKCLTGFEEVLITDFSTALKPCRLIKNKTKPKRCTSDTSCPENNYCNKESCFKCFNCSLINRLPPIDNCARDVNGCGPCMIGFYEIAVTTEFNSKPCEKAPFLISEMPNSYNMSFSNIGSIIFLIIVFVGGILTLGFKKCRGKVLNKTTYNPPVCPSAPPLYTMDAPQKIRKIENKDSPITCIKVEKQQAKVFKQPDALYYFAGEDADTINDVSRNNDVTAWQPASENSSEINCSIRTSTHIYPELGVNYSLMNSRNEELNQIEIMRENVSETVSSIIVDVVDAAEVTERNTEMEEAVNQIQNSNDNET